jgi:hypothetical protein
MVVLAQLAPTHGFQIKWALEFPGAPLGAIEYILTHVVKKMGEIGVRSATFGAGSTGQLERVDNVGGFRVVTLEKTYNGISHAFHLRNKNDFRSKFGIHQDPVSEGTYRSRVVTDAGFTAVHLLPQERSWDEGYRSNHGRTAVTQIGFFVQWY